MVLEEKRLGESLESDTKNEKTRRRLLKQKERIKKQIKIADEKVNQLYQPIRAGERTIHSQSFDETTFEDAFILEMSFAKAFVLIQSPFITPHRVSRLLDALIDCIRRGVTICVYIEDREGTTEQIRRTQQSVKMLRNIGVHVNFKMSIHEKVVVVDGSVCWTGSLNILSYTGKKSEEIERQVDEPLALSLILRFKLHRCSVCTVNSGREQMFVPQPIKQQAKRLGKQFQNVRKKKKNMSFRNLSTLIGAGKSLIQEFESGDRNAGVISVLEMCVWLDAEMMIIPQALIPSVSRLLNQFDSRQYPNSLPVKDASTRFSNGADGDQKDDV